jgi:hypothetical protein
MSRDESIFALYYGRRYGIRASRFWSKISTILLVIEIIAGGTVFAGVIAHGPGVIGAVASVSIALAAAINLTVSPQKKQLTASALREQFAKALRDAPDWDDVALAAKVRELQSIDATEIEALRNPVWRDVCDEIGRPVPKGKIPLSEYLASALG